ncbi:hypothetical protein AVL50_25450 [Flammeovirga sp. SJP92]|nr:hypothetical protein AVL50_25450 [Flammeovirga sp. SJP92]
MKYYKGINDAEYGFQAQVDFGDEKLLKKDIYKEVEFSFIDSINYVKTKVKTDVLDIGSLSFHGLLVSEKFYSICERFDSHQVQFVDIIGDENLKGYKFMFFNGDLTTKIDYRKTNFILCENMLDEFEVLNENLEPSRKNMINIDKEICSVDIFKQLIPKNGFSFIEGFDINKYNIFRIGHFDEHFYFSEKVVKALKAENITGITFVESVNFSPFTHC